MDSFIEYLQNLDKQVVMIAAAVLFLWIFAKAFRSIIKFALVVTLIFVVAWKVPAVHHVLEGIIK